jgi:hypothetical protein|tara:strand:+ start:5949 stop:6134 length:186 start_codon:yes stop_codon:yes gene_type:complete
MSNIPAARKMIDAALEYLQDVPGSKPAMAYRLCSDALKKMSRKPKLDDDEAKTLLIGPSNK